MSVLDASSRHAPPPAREASARHVAAADCLLSMLSPTRPSRGWRSFGSTRRRQTDGIGKTPSLDTAAHKALGAALAGAAARVADGGARIFDLKAAAAVGAVEVDSAAPGAETSLGGDAAAVFEDHLEAGIGEAVAFAALSAGRVDVEAITDAQVAAWQESREAEVAHAAAARHAEGVCDAVPVAGATNRADSGGVAFTRRLAFEDLLASVGETIAVRKLGAGRVKRFPRPACSGECESEKRKPARQDPWCLRPRAAPVP